MAMIEQNGMFGSENMKGARMDHMAITAAPVTFLYVVKKDVKYIEFERNHL